MSFCGVCGRDHEPGPCPIPFVEPESETWESDQYRKLGLGSLVFGLIVLVFAVVFDLTYPLFLGFGGLFVLLGIGGMMLAKQKAQLLNQES